MTLPRFAGQVTHDLLAGYDPADIAADVAYLNEHGHWETEVPEWVTLLADRMMSSPAMVVSVAVYPWLLDKANEVIRRLRALTNPDLTFRDLELKMRDGTVDMRAIVGDEGGQPAMRFLAAAMLHAVMTDDDGNVDEPPNYRTAEIAISPAGSCETMRAFIEVVKPGGKSSHEIRRELEAKLDALAGKLPTEVEK